MFNKRLYQLAATLAFIFGTTSCIGISRLQWKMGIIAYLMATMFRLLAGVFMNRRGDAETVNDWNDHYHRFVVIVLNGVVGVVLLGRLSWDAFRYHTHIGPPVFLAAAFAAYLIAAKFTRPNTFGARVRSATLTIVLIGVMAHLAWSLHWMQLMYVAAAMLGMTWGNLRHLQRRFGWPNR